MRRLWKNRWLWVTAAALATGVAVASPWDIDMTDSRGAKAYSWKMLPPKPEGTLFRPSGAVTRARPNGYYQNDYIAPGDRMAPGVDAMVSPYGDGPEQIATGKQQFQISCAPCHGVNGVGNGPVTQSVTLDSPPQKLARFAMPAPLLSGDGAVTPLRSDGYIYYTIRNGGAVMPAYAVSLTDAERWAIVSYMRTLPGAARPVAAPPTAPVPPTSAPPAAPGKQK